MKKQDTVQSLLVSMSLLILSSLLFIITEVMDTYAVPQPFPVGNYTFACLKENWRAVEIYRSQQGWGGDRGTFIHEPDSNGDWSLTPGFFGYGCSGCVCEYPGLNGNGCVDNINSGISNSRAIAGVTYPVVIGAASDYNETYDPATEHSDQVYMTKPLVWPEAGATEIQVRRWHIRGQMRIVNVRQPDTTDAAEYCLPGWNNDGSPQDPDTEMKNGNVYEPY